MVILRVLRQNQQLEKIINKKGVVPVRTFIAPLRPPFLPGLDAFGYGVSVIFM